jgi:hypothetical protein
MIFIAEDQINLEIFHPMKKHFVKYLILFLLVNASFTIVSGQDVFDEIKTKTWFEHSGFAGVTVVFLKDNNGELKALRQINGSGIPVIATNIFDIEIRQDTIHLFDNKLIQNIKTSESLIYIYNDKQGLTRNVKSLNAIINHPMIHLFTHKNQVIGENIPVYKITMYDFGNNHVFVDDMLYLIDPKE